MAPELSEELHFKARQRGGVSRIKSLRVLSGWSEAPRSCARVLSPLRVVSENRRSHSRFRGLSD
jgi:hypothetical protein